MAYFVNLAGAADWLLTVQNMDGGWGLTKGQASSLVNTAEALFVMDCARIGSCEAAVRGLTFLRDNFDDHLRTRGGKIRFAAFPLLTLASRFPEFDRRFQRRLLKWLVDAENGQGGWGADVGGYPDLYSTYLAVMAIGAIDPHHPILPRAKAWILSRTEGRGWSLDGKGAAPYSATSYALIALHALGERDHPAVVPALESIREINHWGDEEAPLAGTLWKHSTHSNVLTALALYSDDLFSNQIAQGIRYSNSLICGSGGWMETPSALENRTVRSQYWAVVYSEVILSRFDPSKFILRVDSERQSRTLSAPQFQHFLIDTPFAVVVSTRVFRWAVYVMLFVGVALSLGSAPLSKNVDDRTLQWSGLLCLAAAVYLVMVRKLVFPKFGIVIPALVAFISLLDLVLGISVAAAFEGFRALLRAIGSAISGI